MVPSEIETLECPKPYYDCSKEPLLVSQPRSLTVPKPQSLLASLTVESQHVSTPIISPPIKLLYIKIM